MNQLQIFPNIYVKKINRDRNNAVILHTFFLFLRTIHGRLYVNDFSIFQMNMMTESADDD